MLPRQAECKHHENQHEMERESTQADRSGGTVNGCPSLEADLRLAMAVPANVLQRKKNQVEKNRQTLAAERWAWPSFSDPSRG